MTSEYLTLRVNIITLYAVECTLYVKQVQNGEHRCVKNFKILFDIIHKKSYNNIMIRLRIGKNSHNLTKCSHPDMVACRDADASKKCH